MSPNLATKQIVTNKKSSTMHHKDIEVIERLESPLMITTNRTKRPYYNTEQPSIYSIGDTLTLNNSFYYIVDIRGFAKGIYVGLVLREHIDY